MASSWERSAPSGRKVLLFLFLVTILGVGLLLTGPSRTDQVCVHCLEQRHGRVFRVGSFDLGPPRWESENAWPAPSRFAPYLPPPFDTPMAASPRDYRQQVFGAPCEHHWETTARTMPFALFIQIPNTQALRPDAAHLVDTRRIATALFDPAQEEDRACARSLDGVLRTRRAGDSTGGRERRRPETQPGEEVAANFLLRFAEAQGQDGARETVRALACGMSLPDSSE